jgi:hypothetical protein
VRLASKSRNASRHSLAAIRASDTKLLAQLESPPSQSLTLAHRSELRTAAASNLASRSPRGERPQNRAIPMASECVGVCGCGSAPAAIQRDSGGIRWVGRDVDCDAKLLSEISHLSRLETILSVPRSSNSPSQKVNRD